MSINADLINDYTKTLTVKTGFVLVYFRIILEAAYSLYDRAFFDNLATILVMAVVVSNQV